MADLRTLEDLLTHEIQCLHSAETLLLSGGMPRMVQKTENQELKEAFELHMKETEQQVERLKQAAQILGIDPDGDASAGMKGLIADGEKAMHKDAEPEVLDAALIGGAQKIEHYEIASYGTAIALARQLGRQEIASLLHTSLEEEKKTDQILTRIAEGNINKQAAQV
ncbi:YciE/YciF ferroxidase family protein [Hymenobacter sp. HD11105]